MGLAIGNYNYGKSVVKSLAVTPVALGLVLAAAALHPAWNLLAKRASGVDQTAFIWLTSALSAALYVPVVVGLLTVGGMRVRIDFRVDLAMAAGTAV